MSKLMQMLEKVEQQAHLLPQTVRFVAEPGQVPHVGAESVQEDDHRVAPARVICVRLGDQELEWTAVVFLELHCLHLLFHRWLPCRSFGEDRRPARSPWERGKDVL